MNLTKHRFEELSDLRVEISTCPFIGDTRSEALIVSFQGEYGVGSGGNNDARFMSAMVTAALRAWWCRGLILDLREMRYEWGNALLEAVDAGKVRYTFAPFPTALVTSALNHQALEGLMRCEQQSPGEWLFSSMEEALAAVEAKEEANQKARETS